MPARPLLLLALAAIYTPAPAQDLPGGQNSPLANRIHILLADPSAARAHWGIAVSALDGTPLYNLDGDKLFRPASTAKLFTTAAAMALLGPDATVTTTVLGTGTLDSNGVLEGDLLLRGAGDPNLSARILPYLSPAQRKPRPTTTPEAPPYPLGILEDLTAQLTAHGLKQVTGSVLGDDSLWPHDPYPIGWEVDDLVWGYGAPVSALALDDNQVSLTLKPATTGGGFLASLSPSVGYPSQPTQPLNIRSVSSNEPTLLTVDLDQLQKGTLQLGGQLHPEGSHTEDIAVLDPALFAATAFADRLNTGGIRTGVAASCPGDPLPATQSFTAQRKAPLSLQTPGPPTETSTCAHGQPTRVLASHTSAPLKDDITVTLKESLNLHAEMILRRLGAAYADAPTTAQGARVVHGWLTTQAGIPETGFILYDGSGLSTHDLVSPHAEAQLLAYAATQPWFPLWKAALPIGGVDGTLSHRFTDPQLKGHIFAKTGTLGESRALAGYLQCASGHEVIFSILVDNHDPTTSADRTTTDKIVAAIAAEN